MSSRRPLAETRTFDRRNVPKGITVSSNRLAWAYTTDREGNPTAITQTQPAAESRAFGYQDFAYFLTGADDPWGTLDWSYDKIGNRLTQVRNGLAPGDLYTYLPNAATPTPGNTATLDRIDLAVGGTKDYTFGPAGHLERIDESLGATVYDHTAEGQLGTITRGSDQPGMTYDGRSFLRQASAAESTIFQDGFDTGNLTCWGLVAGGEEGDGPTRGGASCFTPAPGGAVTTATYGSEGLLYSVEKRASPTSAGTRFHLFYFAGRPVAEVEVPPTGAPTWTYLTTDHLGTPILATRSNNTERWRGGFEPFGTDWRAGTASGASENGVFLRLPGQWVDGVWGAGESYNLFRWYQALAGSYERPDPLSSALGPIWLFGYARQSPLKWTDPLGLLAVKCEGCGPLKKAEANIRRRLFLLSTQGTDVDDRAGSTNIVAAQTFCGGLRPGVQNQAFTIRGQDFKMPDSPCVFLCTGVHERVHRDMCKLLGPGFVDLSLAESELPAYREDLKCIKTALRDGKLEIINGKVVY
jgi:RHS repeat-associated protein